MTHWFVLTLELKSVQRFLSFSRSSSNSFSLATFLSFFRRFSSRKRCSNSRLDDRKRNTNSIDQRQSIDRTLFSLGSLLIEFHSYRLWFDRMVSISRPRRRRRRELRALEVSRYRLERQSMVLIRNRRRRSYTCHRREHHRWYIRSI